MDIPRLLRNPRFWLAATTVALGAGSYALSQRYLTAREQLIEQKVAGRYASRRVVVAAHELALAAPLKATMLAAREVPVRFLASDAIDTGAVADILDRRLSRPLAAGEVLTASALESDSRASLAASLPAGGRAITISVDEVSSSAGLLSPGDRVDLLYFPSAGASSPSVPSIRPLMQAVRIVATGKRTQRRRTEAGDGSIQEQDTEFATVTLFVSPEEAERIALAQRSGEVTAVLRPEGDTQAVQLPNIRSDELGQSPAAHGRHRRTPVIQYIIGGDGALAHGATSLATRAMPMIAESPGENSQ